MVEKLRSHEESMITNEYSKNWTEKSPNSKLGEINKILNEQELLNINKIKELINKIKNRDYRGFQTTIGLRYNRCDGKLGNESFQYFYNYINKIRREHNLTVQSHTNLQQLGTQIQNENLTDTIHIQRKENKYLAKHETMNQSEYNRLFSGKESLQQGQLGDCYLVSGIHELSRAQHFDTLMRTSIQRVERDKGDKGYEIKIPFGEPSGRKIHIKDSEISVAKIKGNTGYKLLELAYAKNKLRKNDKNGNEYRPITPSELKKISGGRTQEVLQTFLGKNNIGFSDFGTMKNFKNGKTLAQSSQTAKREINNFLKNYVPSIGNKFVSFASLLGSTDKKSYTVGGKTIYCKHAYSLTGIKKDKKGNIISITVLNPWNNGGHGKNYQDFTLDEFYKSFSAISCGKIKTKTFLDEKGTA